MSWPESSFVFYITTYGKIQANVLSNAIKAVSLYFGHRNLVEDTPFILDSHHNPVLVFPYLLEIMISKTSGILGSSADQDIK